MSEERKKCPACGIEYVEGGMGHKTFFTSFRPNDPQSEEYVYGKICRYAKEPEKCVNEKGVDPLPPLDKYLKMADDIRDETNNN